MELKKLGPSMTELELGDGTRVLFSYNTPVAARMPDGRTVKTEHFFSRTTSKHIGLWGATNAAAVPQETIAALVRGR